MSDLSSMPPWMSTDMIRDAILRKKRLMRFTAGRAMRSGHLTPAQHLKTSSQIPEAAKNAASSEVTRRFLKMDAHVLARESWTIDAFSWLLVAKNPTERSVEHSAGDWMATRGQQIQPAIRAVLESCVGVTLTPINPAARPEDQRFRITDIIAVAEAKRLGVAAVNMHSLLTST